MPKIEPTDPKLRSMRGLHLYHAMMSNCSMRVRLVLEEKGISWVSHEVSLGKQENLEDWYLRINPKGLVPAIVHNGLVVTESSDILFYLEEQFPKPALAPTAMAERERMDAWVDDASKLHIKAMKTLVYGSMGAQTKTKAGMAHYRDIQPDQELIDFHEKSFAGFTETDLEDARSLNHQLLARMEKALTEHPWLAGSSYSLADIAWYPNIVLLQMLGFPLGEYPHVRAWAASIKGRPACRPAIGFVASVPPWLIRPALKTASRLRRLVTERRKQTP